MMTRSGSFLLAVFVSALACADVGSQWPDEDEIAKAPPWPKAFQGDPKECRQLEPEPFLRKLNEAPGAEEQDRYVIDAQADLNLDGVCELIAHRPEACGKWCAYEGFQLRSAEYVSIGEVPPGEFLEPFGGWLQIKSASYTGASYFYFLIRFEDGAYKYHRRDEFQEVGEESRTEYVRTLEGKEFADSLQGR